MQPKTITELSSSDAYRLSLIRSPLKFAILMSISIFLVEVFVDTVFHRSRPAQLLDGFLLVIFLSPMLYYFLFLPLFTHISRRKFAEEALTESDERLRVLCSHLLLAQEAERKKISIELHDDLGQSLTFLKLRMKFIRSRLAADQNLLMKECNENLEFIDATINNIRRLSRDLSPSILEDLGLTASLKRLIEDFTKYCQGKETLVSMPDNIDRFFEKPDQILIYRIFQEALTNISRHSRAQHVSISITSGEEEDSVQFGIEDDGGGFDLQKVIESGSASVGMGITAMQHRVRTLGGSLSIDSRMGQGTKLNFFIPKRRTKLNAL